jgi:hypothetical protein
MRGGRRLTATRHYRALLTPSSAGLVARAPVVADRRGQKAPTPEGGARLNVVRLARPAHRRKLQTATYRPDMMGGRLRDVAAAAPRQLAGGSWCQTWPPALPALHEAVPVDLAWPCTRLATCSAACSSKVDTYIRGSGPCRRVHKTRVGFSNGTFLRLLRRHTGTERGVGHCGAAQYLARSWWRRATGVWRPLHYEGGGVHGRTERPSRVGGE